MRRKFIFFVFILLVLSFSNAQAKVEKLSKLMPPNTELISQDEDKSQELITVTTYKFSSSSSKEKIFDFYQRLFANEGFSELKTTSPDGSLAGDKAALKQWPVYLFSRANELAFLNIYADSTNETIVYYITLNETNNEAIKSFNSKKKQLDE